MSVAIRSSICASMMPALSDGSLVCIWAGAVSVGLTEQKGEASCTINSMASAPGAGCRAETEEKVARLALRVREIDNRGRSFDRRLLGNT